MQTGTRWAGRPNPRDLTATRQRQLLAEKARREAAQDIDIAEVRQRAHNAGHAAGYEQGLKDGWDTCIAALVDEGILDPDEPGDDAGEDT